jgi:hypothetical protein
MMPLRRLAWARTLEGISLRHRGHWQGRSAYLLLAYKADEGAGTAFLVELLLWTEPEEPDLKSDRPFGAQPVARYPNGIGGTGSEGEASGGDRASADPPSPSGAGRRTVCTMWCSATPTPASQLASIGQAVPH